MSKVDLTPIYEFLHCPTPEAWLNWALEHTDVLLIDHAHCEKKAASTALNLMFKYADKNELLMMLSQLAREELLHFEQVLALMNERGVPFGHLVPSDYAGKLRQHVRTYEPVRLVDILIVGGIIEARSCERFAALAPRVDERLSRYYRYLLKSEARHFEDYLHLARLYAEEDITDRVAFFLREEKILIQESSEVFRFHSGVPAA